MRRNPIRRTGRYKNKRNYYKKKLRRYRKKGYVKRPQKSLKVRGYKQKFNNKTELKWTDSVTGNVVGFALTDYVVFSFNQDRPTIGRYFTTPLSGVAQNEMIGTQINALSMDIRFSIRMNAANVITKARQNYRYRLSVLRSKEISLNLVTQPGFPTSLNTPYNPKEWKVLYDRIIQRTSGYFGNTVQSMMDKDQNWKFRIPLKMTMEKQLTVNGVSAFQIPYDIIIVFSVETDSQTVFDIVNYTSRFYYKDP